MRGEEAVLDLDHAATLLPVLGAARLRALAALLGENLAELLAAVAGGALESTIEARVHQLRGGAGTLGMSRLAAALAAIEPAITEGDGAARVLATGLPGLYAETVAALERWLGDQAAFSKT